jgi:hypothetical protein
MVLQILANARIAIALITHQAVRENPRASSSYTDNSTSFQQWLQELGLMPFAST